jgi:hypothetical protein
VTAIYCSIENDESKYIVLYIFKVIPRDGPVDGGTRITVYGLNLGSTLLDNTSAEIANIRCEINDDMSHLNDPKDHSGIFQTNVRNR